MIALALRYWWAIAIAALCMALAFSRMQVSEAHREFSDYRLAQQEVRILADKAQRTEEQRRQTAVDKEAQDAQTKITALEADSRAANDAAARLHAAIGAAVSGARKDSRIATAGKGEPGSDSLDLLARVLTRSDDAAGELSLYADRLALAGGACERISDRLQPAAR